MPNTVVLVAEDDVVLLDLMAVALERRLEVRVAVARDGLQALRQAKSLHPDVIVVDAELPGLDDAQVLRMLKSQHATKGIPVIGITRNGTPLGDDLAARCEDSIAHSFSPDSFADVVRRHLPREEAHEPSRHAEWRLAASV